jgi:CYTH domain-containing protein/predicted ATPase
MERRHIPVVVITGGPCSGKTTLISVAQQRLADLGFTVITVSEAATEFIVGGLKPWEISAESFQLQLMRYIMQKEDIFKAGALAHPGEKVVILCDRGTMDSRAYMAAHEFDRMLGTLGHTIVDACDKRYDAVVFMHSVAVDKPELFTLENNAARTEAVETAVELNRKTLDAWVGHPHMTIVDNADSLESKLTRAFAAICHAVEIPAPLEIEHKFVLDPGYQGLPPFPAHTVQAAIEQYYLKTDDSDVEERVRAWSRGRGTAYYHTLKELVRPGVRREWERNISERAFFELLKRADPECGKIEKWRHCFVWNGRYYELDSIPRIGAVYLEVELTEEGETLALPPGYAEIFTEVTGDAYHSNHQIARRLGQAS